MHVFNNIISYFIRLMTRFLYGSIFAGSTWDHEKIVELLLSKGANVKDLSLNGENALMSACISGTLSTIHNLLAQPSLDINNRSSDAYEKLQKTIKKEDIKSSDFKTEVDWKNADWENVENLNVCVRLHFPSFRDTTN